MEERKAPRNSVTCKKDISKENPIIEIVEKNTKSDQSAIDDMGNMSRDNAIIEKILNGDQEGLNELKSEYGLLYKTIMKEILHDNEDVLECENDLLFSMWKKIHDDSDLPRNLKAYVVRTARNKAIDIYRKRKRRIQTDVIDKYDEVSSNNNVEDSITSEKMRLSVISFLKKSPRDDRVLYTLRFIRCMNIDQIAELLGENYNTVASRISRLREKLKRHLIMEGFLNEYKDIGNEK